MPETLRGPWQCKRCSRVCESNEEPSMRFLNAATGEEATYCKECTTLSEGKHRVLGTAQK